MKLSIIIPLFNKEKFIGRCLQSLLGQDLPYSAYEILIVDDGSTDSGASIAREYSENHENIHFFQQENAGPSAARNRALDRAQGDYLYFLDADDLLAPKVLPGLISLCEESNLDILEFNTREIEDDSVIEVPDTSSHHTRGLAVPAMEGLSYVAEHDFRNQAWRYFIGRRFLLDSGIRFLEDMRAYEDLIFMASVLLKSRRTASIALEAHRYVKVAGSIVRTRDPKKNLEFIKAMVKCVEQLDVLIKGLNRSVTDYAGVVRRLRGKQQAVVFALFVKAFKYRVLSRKELDLIIDRLKKLRAYPIDPKIGGIGDGNILYNKFFVPIFNNRTLLHLGTGLVGLMPRK